MKPSKENYNTYFQQYIDLVPSENLLEELSYTLEKTLIILNEIPSEKENFRYVDGKWTIKELVLHCIDCERIFQFRALTFARNDKTNLPGFEEDFYVDNSFCENRTLKDIIDELITVRKSTISLFKSFGPDVINNSGVANGGECNVNACGFIIIGHLTHHMQILQERYLK